MNLEQTTRIEMAALYSPASVLFSWGLMWIIGLEGRVFNTIMIFVLATSVAVAETVRAKRRYRRTHHDRRRNHGLAHNR